MSEILREQDSFENIFTINPMLSFLFPDIATELKIPKKTASAKCKDLLRYIISRVKRRLVSFAKKALNENQLLYLKKRILGKAEYNELQKPGKLEELMESLGMKRLDAEKIFDKDVYEMIRNLEGYNLTNTFVGNYLEFSIYQKVQN
jgi:hypothetical protein